MDWKFQAETFLLASLVGIVLTLLSLAAGTIMGADLPSPVAFFAVLTSFSCTFLFVLERRQAYLWGFVTTVLYAIFFWTELDLKGSAVVQIYLFGALIYGFFRWGRDADTRPVTHVRKWWHWVLYGALTGATWTGAMILSYEYGTEVLAWDAAIMVLSILAQWLLDNKKLETWAVWVLVNAIAIPWYWSQDGGQLVAIQYAFFLANAVWGWYMWQKSMNEDPFQRALRQGRAIVEGRYQGTEY